MQGRGGGRKVKRESSARVMGDGTALMPCGVGVLSCAAGSGAWPWAPSQHSWRHRRSDAAAAAGLGGQTTEG